MNGELRILGIAHGLLLGLVLASPAIGPAIGSAWLPWGVEALFIVAGFQLRLADRRWETRAGLRGWVSHIRMAPGRLVPWAATAVVAVIAGPDQARLAASILTAVLLSELLIYPVGANLLGRLPRAGVAGLLLLLLIGCGMGEPGQAARLALAFSLGVSGCVFWMRGPDGEAHTTASAGLGCGGAIFCAWLFPDTIHFVLPWGVLLGTLMLAHLSVMRRHIRHWRFRRGSGLRWMLKPSEAPRS